jgi:hypothetical protein
LPACAAISSAHFSPQEGGDDEKEEDADEEEEKNYRHKAMAHGSAPYIVER